MACLTVFLGEIARERPLPPGAGGGRRKAGSQMQVRVRESLQSVKPERVKARA